MCPTTVFYFSQVYSYQENLPSGSSYFDMLFYAYDNPSDETAGGRSCDQGVDNFCDIVFDICVSDQGYE